MPLILDGTSTGGSIASFLTIDDTNDRVGIGTTSPTVLLDLESTAPTIKFTDTDATGTPECEVSGAGGDLILRADKDNEKSSSLIAFEIDGSEKVRIKSDGNVGIGTNNPADKLHILDGDIGIENSSGRRYRFIAETAGGFTIRDQDAAQTRIHIDTSGRVGIGEASPQRSVVVKGANSSTTSIQFQTPGTGSAASDGFGVGYDSNGKGFIWNYESNDIYIGGTTSGTVVTVRNNGNLGVGTQSPDQKMHLYTDAGTTLYKAEVNANSTVGLEIKKTGSTTQSWRIVDGQTVNGALQFYDVTDSRVAMQIDGTGNLLVAKTVSDGAIKGFEARATGQVMATVASATNEAVMYITQTGGGGNNGDDQGLVVKTQGTNAVSGTGNVLRIAANNSTHGTFDNILVAKNNGNVGIGTNNPQTILDVQSNSTLTNAEADLGVYHRFVNTNANINTGSGISFGSNSNAGATIYAQRTGSNNEHKMGFQTRNSSGSGTTRMTILGNGNVGIGTTNPTSPLHVVSGEISNGQNKGIKIDNFNASKAYSFRTGITGSENTSLSIHDDTSGVSRITINTLGNVGIGTISPGVRLHVVGGSDANLYLKSDSSRSGAFLMKPGTNTIMGSILQLADETYRLGTASHYHLQMNQNGQTIINATGNNVGMGVTPYANAKLTIGGTDSGGYNSVLMFDNNNSNGAEFFMVATDGNWSAGSNKFIMGHGAPSSSNVDVTIDSTGNVGIGSSSPICPLNIVHTNFGSEPFCALRIKNTSSSGYYYTGIEVDAVGQSHVRYSLGGSLKWQTRVGLGAGTDKFSIYSWSHGDDMHIYDTSGRMHAKSLSISASPGSPPTGNLYSSGDGIIISAGTGVGFSGGAGVGTHLEMGTNSDAGWASQYVQRYNYGGGGANDDRMFQFTVNGGAQGYIKSTTSGTTFQGSSDYRIKKNIVNLTDTDGIIKQLRPVEFEMTTEEGTDFEGVKHVGFLAHEVQEAGVTDCVSGTKDQVDEDGDPVIQGMDYGRLTPYLVKSLQDALTKIDALETRIKTLES